MFVCPVHDHWLIVVIKIQLLFYSRLLTGSSALNIIDIKSIIFLGCMTWLQQWKHILHPGIGNFLKIVLVKQFGVTPYLKVIRGVKALIILKRI